jgi:RimJ/RimL family protein N-acetyltransferase
VTTHRGNEATIALSEVDELRFGCRTAKAGDITRESVPELLEYCRDNAVRLLIARCRHDDIQTAQAMEESGFRLMDSLVYYARNLVKTPIPADVGHIPVRPMKAGEEIAVSQVALEAFHNYISHYHADPHLNPTDCDLVYASWAEALARSRGERSAVFVASSQTAVIGFAGVRLNNPLEGEGVLYGVTPSAQGYGICPSLMVATMNWCVQEGAKRMLISTQINNIHAQRVYARMGFEPHSGYYTFHKWFDTV